MTIKPRIYFQGKKNEGQRYKVSLSFFLFIFIFNPDYPQLTKGVPMTASSMNAALLFKVMPSPRPGLAFNASSGMGPRAISSSTTAKSSLLIHTRIDHQYTDRDRQLW